MQTNSLPYSETSMAIANAIVFSGIVPHPPIMVPEVGREASEEVRASVAAMAEFTRRLIASGAKTVLLISPHAPLDARAFVAYHTPKLRGDFANFGARNTRLEFPLDEALLEHVTQAAAVDGYEVRKLGTTLLDHGSAVPLYFLDRFGWHGNVVALGYSYLNNEAHFKFGRCVSTAIAGVGRPVALVASGDLSHRLKPEAPAGYDPAAYRFDEEVVAALQENSPRRIAAIDHALRRTAGECGYRSLLIALGATEQLTPACEVLSYEAPFGVGYLVAQITSASGRSPTVREGLLPFQDTVMSDDQLTSPASPDADFDSAAPLPALARAAIETFVLSGQQITPPEQLTPLLAARAACFVSIKTNTGDLRGCIGTIEPCKENLAEEIIANAINAATRDPRFAPVTAGELASLRYSVDVLGATEPATFADLDPKRYGVIVADESGERRGLLLPDIAGVETASQQVEIAAHKAGIRPGTPLKLARFRVDRFREE
jgi:AmmeMemoRadiSam system protein A